MSKKIGFVCAVVGAMGMLGLNAANSAPLHEKHHVTQKRHALANKKAKREVVRTHVVETSWVETEEPRKETRERRAVRKVVRASVRRNEEPQVRRVSWGKIPVRINVRREVIDRGASNGDILKVSSRVPADAENKPYSGIINHYAETYGVPISLAHAVVHHESNYNADARGSVGEIGLMQVRLSTARSLGYNGSARGLFNPVTNVQYGMKYLAMAEQLSGGSVCGTILKYNAGHGATRMNPISARYCNQVKLYMRSF